MHVSSMCSAVKLYVGVCTVGAHARVLARARRCVLRRCRLMSPRASGAARPASSPGATVRRPAPRPTRHGAVHGRSFFLAPFTHVTRLRSVCRLHSRAGSPPHIRFAREKCRARGVPYLTRLVHASRAPALRMREFTPGGGTHTYLPVQACVKASARQAFDRALGVRA